MISIAIPGVTRKRYIATPSGIYTALNNKPNNRNCKKAKLLPSHTVSKALKKLRDNFCFLAQRMYSNFISLTEVQIFPRPAFFSPSPKNFASFFLWSKLIWNFRGFNYGCFSNYFLLHYKIILTKRICCHDETRYEK